MLFAPVLIKDPGEIHTAHVFRLFNNVSRIWWDEACTFVHSKVEVVKVPPSTVLTSVVVVGVCIAAVDANNAHDLLRIWLFRDHEKLSHRPERKTSTNRTRYLMWKCNRFIDIIWLVMTLLCCSFVVVADDSLKECMMQSSATIVQVVVDEITVQLSDCCTGIPKASNSSFLLLVGRTHANIDRNLTNRNSEWHRIFDIIVAWSGRIHWEATAPKENLNTLKFFKRRALQHYVWWFRVRYVSFNPFFLYIFFLLISCCCFLVLGILCHLCH